MTPRSPGGARREDDGHQIVFRDRVDAEDALQQGQRQKYLQRGYTLSIGEAPLPGLREDHLDLTEIDRHAFEERAGGDHMAQAGLLYGVTDELLG